MIKVKLRGTETTDQLLKRFKKACEKENLVKDLKKNAFYEKPSEEKRRRNKSRPLGGQRGYAGSNRSSKR